MVPRLDHSPLVNVKQMNAREAAYQAVLASLKQEKFVSDFLEGWKREENPSDADFRLAQEIANGTVRMALSLDEYAKQLTEGGKLSLKIKEKALLRTALYQRYFMNKIPPYAIVNESVSIAKKSCHITFVSFLNMLLRKMSQVEVQLPQGDSPREISIRTSFPEYFVKALIEEYGREQTLQILEASNKPPKLMVRDRFAKEAPQISVVESIPPFNSDRYYIQNSTPGYLMWHLKQNSKIEKPHQILDLCAAPGGKLLAAHDYFPEALLFGNDISQKKLNLLRENSLKYHFHVNLSCQRGELFSTPEKFSIILIDAPCSNTGVLNKRVEARWRLSEEQIKAHVQLQSQLIEHSIQFLEEGGEIWYMTCSILRRENQSVAYSSGLKIGTEKLLLPNLEGEDGGYCASLTV